MQPLLFIDFETRSLLDLTEVGLHRYARHPSTSPWCMSFALNDDEPIVWLPSNKNLPPWIQKHIQDGLPVIAHSAAFELEVWNEIMVPRNDWPELKPEQTFCSMAMSYAMGFPGALEDAALAIGLPIQKDMEGRALMLRMARPRSLDPLTWWDEPEKLKRLYAYCNQDVRVERALYKRLLPLSDRERKIWLMDYQINKRGVQADIETAKAALILAHKTKEKADQEMRDLTAGEVESCNALIPLKAWLNRHGCPAAATGLDKQAVIDLLTTDKWQPEVIHALHLRQESSKASTSKLDRMIAQAGDDGRLHFLFQYHGAAPGRWTGRGVQPHNFVRDVPPPDVVESVFKKIRDGDIDAINMIYGEPLKMLSRSMRGFLTAAPDKVIVGGDYSNVEGRGQAWISGEEWKLAAFRAADNGTGPEIYVLTASKILGIPVNEITKELRQAYGKVPELALGYAGAEGAFAKMAKVYGVKLSREKILEIVNGWRDAHPMLAGVRTLSPQGHWYRKGGAWKALNAAAIEAASSPDTLVTANVAQPIKYKRVGSFLWCLLPSDRAICYPYPKVIQGLFGPQLTYMTVPGIEDERIDDPQNSPRWARVTTHGGSLFQNVVSGICRDLLADAMLRLEDMLWPIVLHVHDDINTEVRLIEAQAAQRDVNMIMNAPSMWAKDFPLVAKAKVMKRYGG